MSLIVAIILFPCSCFTKQHSRTALHSQNTMLQLHLYTMSGCSKQLINISKLLDYLEYCLEDMSNDHNITISIDDKYTVSDIICPPLFEGITIMMDEYKEYLLN